MKITPIEQDIQTLSNPEMIATETLKPRYEVTQNGILFYRLDKNKNGELIEKEPLKLCSTLHLVGRGIDANGDHYRIIEWKDPHTKRTKRDVLPTGEIGTIKGWVHLQSMGIVIYSGRLKREKLADYLQSKGDDKQWKITNKSGWIDDKKAYILPSGDIVGDDVAVIYKGTRENAQAYQSKGILNEWQVNVASFAKDNSRLCFALGIAFACPLLDLLEMENGGFHLFGDSTAGKTTTAHLALSVWGNPKESDVKWSGTALGFTNVALERNDNLLVLDEIGQANSAKVVSQTAYSIINGKSKIQGAKDGGNRAINKWRILALSTGEKTLQRYIESNGESWNAGQEIRLPSVPVDAQQGYGIFDTIHNYTNVSDFANTLNDNLANYHGTAGKAFILEILKDQQKSKDLVKGFINEFMQTLPKILSGQDKRVIKRFALVAGALELATEYGITGLQVGAGIDGVKKCFSDWFACNGGAGLYEDKRIIEQAIRFMQQAIADNCFITVNNDGTMHQPYTKPTVGYKKVNGSEIIYMVTANIFSKEIAKGYDLNKVAQVLHAHNNWLKGKTKDGRLTWKVKGLSGRFFIFNGDMPSSEDD